jgi:predicted Fe-Mo cluster-binding NifX family protein
MKILITIVGSDVAPRFDLVMEVIVFHVEDGKVLGEPRTILLPGASAEELCSLIIKEDISLVITGGIEDVHYQYLTWKKVQVIDGIIGPYGQALELALAGGLERNQILAG